jgi:hypothetical protein
METNIGLRKLEFHRHMALLVSNRRCSRILRPSCPSIVTAQIWTLCRSAALPVAAPLVRLSLNVSSLYPAVSLKRDMSRCDKLNTTPRLPPRHAVHSLGMCLNRAGRAGHNPHRRSLDHLPKSYPRHSLLPPWHFETAPHHATRSFVSLRGVIASFVARCFCHSLEKHLRHDTKLSSMRILSVA